MLARIDHIGIAVDDLDAAIALYEQRLVMPVVHREIAEEIGLAVTDVEYLGSQPWPFPRSLMVGFHAVGDPEQPFSFNDGEIAEAGWFTRAEVRDALENGDWSSDSPSRLLLPGSISIAREIIESWAAQD